MSYKDFLPSATNDQKARLDVILADLYEGTDFFSAIVELKTGTFLNVSPSFESLTGYPLKKIEKNGIGFFTELVHPEDCLHAIAVQANAIKNMNKTDLLTSTNQVFEIEARIKHKNGEYLNSVSLIAILAIGPDFLIEKTLGCLYFLSDDFDRNNTVKQALIVKLREATHLYKCIFPLPLLKTVPDSLLPSIATQINPPHILTAKEKAVLMHIANGLSSKQIADTLHISENTVESHRKNMLKKYDSKNIAELVKKLSKLYWLE